MTNSDGGDLERSIVPDIAIEGVLYDVKTVAATTEHYAPHHIEHYVKMEHKRGNAPVDRRARLVNGQYLKKAHNLDVKYNSVGGVECGPMENYSRPGRKNGNSREREFPGTPGNSRGPIFHSRGARTYTGRNRQNPPVTVDAADA